LQIEVNLRSFAPLEKALSHICRRMKEEIVLMDGTELLPLVENSVKARNNI
jgi:hypothetical protein